MSLPFLPETAAEVHRLAIAGSGLAAGDYRLKKLIPSLEGLAAKAPVFGRIAQSVRAVTDETDPAAAGRALLDLSALLTAIQYTQSPHDFPGDLEPVPSSATTWAPTTVTHRSLSAVIEALVAKGEGRLEILRDAHERGLFKDLRLMQPAVGALHDNYGELSTYVAEEVLPQFGAAVIPLLMDGFDPKGGRPHARRITALCALDPAQGRAICRRILPEATKEVKVAVVAGLTGSAEDVDTLLDMTKEKAQEVRHAAILSLKGVNRPDVLEFLRTGVKGKDGAVVAQVAVASGDKTLAATVRESFVEAVAALKPDGKEKMDKISGGLEALRADPAPETLALLIDVFGQCVQADPKKDLPRSEFAESLAGALLDRKHPDAYAALLESFPGRRTLPVSYAFAAGAKLLDADALFERFSPELRDKDAAGHLRVLLGGGISYSGMQTHYRFPRVPRSSISPRWLDAALDVDDPGLVVLLAVPGHARALEYLRAKEAAQEKKTAGRDYDYEITRALCRLEPDKAPALLMRRLVALQKAASYVWWGSTVYSDLAKLPPSVVPELESMAGQLKDHWRDRLDQVIAELRHQATNTSTVTS